VLTHDGDELERTPLLTLDAAFAQEDIGQHTLPSDFRDLLHREMIEVTAHLAFAVRSSASGWPRGGRSVPLAGGPSASGTRC
jgi:hypothetical protein